MFTRIHTLQSYHLTTHAIIQAPSTLNMMIKTNINIHNTRSSADDNNSIGAAQHRGTI